MGDGSVALWDQHYKILRLQHGAVNIGARYEVGSTFH